MTEEVLLLALILVASVLLAVLRIRGVKSQAFQAAAHLWVGFLIASAILFPPLWVVVAALSVVEVAVFVSDKQRQ